MAGRTDWLPGRRAAQLELAKRWSPLVTLQKTYWKIQVADIKNRI